MIEQADLCRAANSYRIYEASAQFETDPLAKEHVVGEFEESHSCCQNLLCEFREFELHCSLYGEDFSTAYRPLRNFFECLGCCPQEMVVTKNRIKLGALRVPTFFGCGQKFKWAGLHIEVIDGHDKLAYTIESDLCQVGTLCCCLRSCVGKHIEYCIFDGQGKAVGRIVNIFNGCALELFSKQDRFGLELPKSLPTDHKKLLMNAPIFIDFLRYEKFI